MIGTGFRKFASERDLKVSKGVAYGFLNGYAVTLSEGAGFKRVDIATVFADPAQRMALTQLLNQTDLAGLYRMSQIGMESDRTVAFFRETPGTLKKLQAFLDWFLPLLPYYGASAGNVCTRCGGAVSAGKWVLVDGTARYLHEACAESCRRNIEGVNAEKKQADNGSYAMGFLGALLGALLGVVAWAIVLYLGYFASVVGLLIGFLARKGYDLLRGKQGRGKVFVLAAVVLLGVTVGTFGADVLTLLNMLRSGELPGFTPSDIPLLMSLLLEDPEYVAIVVKNILMGLLFAGLGVFGMLKQTAQQTAGVKYQEL